MRLLLLSLLAFFGCIVTGQGIISSLNCRPVWQKAEDRETLCLNLCECPDSDTTGEFVADCDEDTLCEAACKCKYFEEDNGWFGQWPGSWTKN